jgi:hypothetical protein
MFVCELRDVYGLKFGMGVYNCSIWFVCLSENETKIVLILGPSDLLVKGKNIHVG